MSIQKETNGAQTKYLLNGEPILSAERSQSDGKLRVSVSGTVKTIAAPCFSEIIADSLAPCEDFVLDLAGLTYIASAGLRVLLNMQQKIDEDEKPEVTIVNLTPAVREVFESTGFIHLLNVEPS